MRLLYCSTIKYPSRLANRYQVLAMAKALSNELGENFILGVRKVQGGEALGISNVITFGGSRRSFLLALRYVRFIIKNQITHIYSRNDSLLFFIMLYLSILSRKKRFIIFELHRVPEQISRRIRYVLTRAGLVVVVTSFIKKELVKKGFSPNKIPVLPDGVDLLPFEKLRTVGKGNLRNKFTLPMDKKIITYVGTLHTLGMSKGVEDLIETFPVVLKKVPDAFLLLVGFQEVEIKEVSMVLQKLGVPEARFRVLPFLPQEDAQAHMVASDVLVMNFPWTKHYAYYMSPMKMFEYMASGNPIITTDLPSVREVLNQSNAYFIKPENGSELASSITTLINDKKLSQKIAEQAFLDVQSYTWDRRAGKIFSLLNEKV